MSLPRQSASSPHPSKKTEKPRMLASKPRPCHHLDERQQQRLNKPIRSQVNLCSSSNFREIPNLSLTHHVALAQAASPSQTLHLRFARLDLIDLPLESVVLRRRGRRDGYGGRALSSRHQRTIRRCCRNSGLRTMAGCRVLIRRPWVSGRQAARPQSDVLSGQRGSGRRVCQRWLRSEVRCVELAEAKLKRPGVRAWLT